MPPPLNSFGRFVFCSTPHLLTLLCLYCVAINPVAPPPSHAATGSTPRWLGSRCVWRLRSRPQAQAQEAQTQALREVQGKSHSLLSRNAGSLAAPCRFFPLTALHRWAVMQCQGFKRPKFKGFKMGFKRPKFKGKCGLLAHDYPYPTTRPFP